MADFAIDKNKLNQVNQEKDVNGWKELGGVERVAALLKTNAKEGLSSSSVARNREAFGSNAFKEVPPRTFLSMLLDTLKDPTLILLMCAATVSTILGSAIPSEREHKAWIEGVAIWVAVILVSIVGSVNDYQKELQFRKLNAEKDAINVKVVRDGKEQLVPNTDIVVGDVMMLDTGDKVIADGVEIEGHGLTIDEASLTGESDPIKKLPDGDFWIRSGSQVRILTVLFQVTDGDARVLITAVGPNSEWGMIMEKVAVEEDAETPLQQKLGYVASAIAKVGTAVAVCAFVVLLIRWCVEKKGFPWREINNNGPLNFFLYSITIIVVAIPEGLPLAVTISLAYSMKKMMRDNNFVRHLAACETMGGATAICSDKTGTLTENRMTVVEGWFAGTKYSSLPKLEQLPGDVGQEIIYNICLNSKAFYTEEPGKKAEFVGNRTECALLQLCQKVFNTPYDGVRKQNESKVVQLYGFSSAKKMASVLVDRGDGTLRLYNKGASEWVLNASVAVYEPDGSIAPLTEAKKSQLLQVLTYTDFPKEDPTRPATFFDEPPDRNLTVCCIVGIKDPVRKEVPGAVATCKRAGIMVRMVTGDNIHTAQHIARECGILDDSGFAMEGPTFRNTPREEMKKRLPKLQVLARSSPTDKHTLVNMLRELGEVVAVTGDGTNDAPALKESDVGLAMGIAGTEVAKEAADIVILDDNFKSIVLAVLWGRSVFNNIRKFMQFQLTINIVALVIAFVGAFARMEPLNVLQLLWVNLIMDTLAALALATESPHVSLLSYKPHGREAPLINLTMWKHMCVQALYQITWMLIILFAAPKVIDRYHIRDKCELFRGGDDMQPFCKSKDVADLTEVKDIEKGCRAAFPIPAGSNCPIFEKPTLQSVRPECNEDAECLKDAEEIWKLWDKARGYRQYHTEKDEEASKSVLFNAFIFMQVFNEFNARKILDEYNIFSGIFTSPIFMGVITVTVALQILIMQTGIATLFHVHHLDGWEWLGSILIGAGCIPVSFIVRFITRNVFGVNVPEEGIDKVEMDIGYGAVVTTHSEGKTAVVSDSEPANGGNTRVQDIKNTELTALKDTKGP